MVFFVKAKVFIYYLANHGIHCGTCGLWFEDSNEHSHSLKAYSNSSSVLGKVKGGSSFFISSSKSILDSKSEKNEKIKLVTTVIAAFSSKNVKCTCHKLLTIAYLAKWCIFYWYCLPILLSHEATATAMPKSSLAD